MATDCSNTLAIREATCKAATDLTDMITLSDDGTLTTNYGAKPISLMVKEKLINDLQRLGISYVWTDSTERNSQVGMVADEQGYQIDTNKVYKYNGSAWVFYYTVGGGVTRESTISTLRARTETPKRIFVSGYHVDGDGAFGSNIFEWDSTSTEADNNGTIIKLTSVATGRYKLKYNGTINVKWFGDEALESTINSACALQVPTRFNIPSTIRVPTDFTNIQTALDNIKGNQDIKLTLKLESGFTMSEQVIVNGYDYGNVIIISEDATVSVDESSITVETIEYEDLVPIFTGINHAVLPTIGCLFEYTDNTTSKDAFALSHSSKVRFLPSSYTNATPVSGCRKARRGLTLLNNSEAECNPDGLTQADTGLSVGVDFSGCRNRALNIQHGSRASLAKSNFNDSEGDNAVYVIWNSFADIYKSTVTGHLGSNAAIHSRDGSVVCARETDVSNATGRGYHALHSAMLDARYGTAQNCGTYGVLASSASIIDSKAVDVSGCGIGVHASDGSKVEASEAVATNCTNYGLYARGASEITGINATISNSNTGILAQDGSTIDADSTNVSGCDIGYHALSTSSINFNDSTVDSNTIGAKAEYSSELNLDGVAMTNCTTYGLFVSEASNAQARNITASGAGTNVYCIRGSNANVRGATLTNATNYGIYCIESSNVNAQSTNTTGAGTYGFYVARGAIINAGSSTGTLSKAINTLTSDGIIYQ